MPIIQFVSEKLSGDSLKARFLRGSVWLAAGNIIEKALAFVSKIILARILMPEELGIIVLIASITGLFECLTEVGVKQCIIQSKKSDSREFLDAVWWFSSIRGMMLFVLAWILTPWICNFYFEDQDQVLAQYGWSSLHMMVRIAFLCVLLNGLISPRAHLQEKQFNFARVVAYVQSAALTGTILTIVLSFILHNAWAMVWGFVCQVFLRMVMSYVFCPFWPKMQFHRESWREIMLFAKGMWGSPFFAYIAYNIDVLVGGKIVGPELIGLYGFAVGLAYIPRDLFGRIVNPVLMPAFAESQDDKNKLKKTVGQIVSTLMLTAAPAIVLCFIFNRQFITLVYGQSFEPVSLIFAIMTLNVLLIMINMVFVNLFFGLGMPEISRNYTFIRAAILICLTAPVAHHFGLAGMAIMQVISNFALVMLFVHYAKKLINLNLRQALIPSFLDKKYTE